MNTLTSPRDVVQNPSKKKKPSLKKKPRSFSGFKKRKSDKLNSKKEYLSNSDDVVITTTNPLHLHLATSTPPLKSRISSEDEENGEPIKRPALQNTKSKSLRQLELWHKSNNNNNNNNNTSDKRLKRKSISLRQFDKLNNFDQISHTPSLSESLKSPSTRSRKRHASPPPSPSTRSRKRRSDITSSKDKNSTIKRTTCGEIAPRQMRDVLGELAKRKGKKPKRKISTDFVIVLGDSTKVQITLVESDNIGIP